MEPTYNGPMEPWANIPVFSQSDEHRSSQFDAKKTLAQALLSFALMVDAAVALAFAPLAPVALFFVAARVMPKTYNYELKYRHRVVYRGITNSPGRRFAEHRRDGKRFTHARVTAWSFFRVLARRREAFVLAQYRRGHGGQNPFYNRRDDG